MFVSALHTLGLSLDDWTVHDAEHWLCETAKSFKVAAACLHDLLFPVTKLAVYLATTMTAR